MQSDRARCDVPIPHFGEEGIIGALVHYSAIVAQHGSTPTACGKTENAGCLRVAEDRLECTQMSSVIIRLQASHEPDQANSRNYQAHY